MKRLEQKWHVGCQGPQREGDCCVTSSDQVRKDLTDKAILWVVPGPAFAHSFTLCYCLDAMFQVVLSQEDCVVNKPSSLLLWKFWILVIEEEMENGKEVSKQVFQMQMFLRKYDCWF